MKLSHFGDKSDGLRVCQADLSRETGVESQ